MPKTLMRIPYTGLLPKPRIIPPDCTALPNAVAALARFLVGETSGRAAAASSHARSTTVVLSGAGISVASGLADYRGANGTYRQNQSYRPIYYTEFVHGHEARKRYWARSFLGWTILNNARPNAAHLAIGSLGNMGLVNDVVTQNVDSFHAMAHPSLNTIELHGFLRSLVCLTCGNHLDRSIFQESLSKLNPAWSAFLAKILVSGALDTENPAERRARGMTTNPDGDVDVPGAPYSTFRYPACPSCLNKPPVLADGAQTRVEVDDEGAWLEGSTAGILKPAVIMFGESISEEVKVAAENAIDEASRILVVGSSLATYSAWRLVRRAKERRMPIGILNLGGVRGEEEFFKDLEGHEAVRLELSVEELLPAVVEHLRDEGRQEADLGMFYSSAESWRKL